MKLMLTAVLFVSLLTAACAPAATPPAEAPMAEEAPSEPAAPADIVDTAIAAGDFGTLVTAVQEAGLVETLKGDGPFTVFAPNDAAFAALPEGTIESLLADPEGALKDILLYHVVSGKVMAGDVVGLDGQMVETVGGQSFTVTIDGDKVMVDNAQVIATDIETSNGVIHVLDAVIIPVAGEAEAAEGDSEAAAEAAMMDIVDTAVAAGSFTTVVTAVQEAGLVETLKGEGPFTVFAPTDEAFAALPEGTVESLLADPEGALTDILLYHVVSGKVMASDVLGLDGQSVGTVGEGTILITIDGDSVMINESNVVAADIETSNGVIHVIDAVLIPAQ